MPLRTFFQNQKNPLIGHPYFPIIDGSYHCYGLSVWRTSEIMKNQPQVVNDVDIGLPEDDVPQSPTVWWFGKAMSSDRSGEAEATWVVYV